MLGCAVADELYARFPQLPEGKLTRLRASLVREESLAAGGARARPGRPGARRRRRRSRRRSSPMRWKRCSARCSSTAATPRRGARWCRRFGPLLEQLDPARVEKDAKTGLQELLHARGKPLPEYRVVATHGAPHERSFDVECAVGDLTSTGHGTSRQRAEQEAAKAMLDKTPDMSAHRCGTIGLAGRPNTGKSSLLNRLVGEKVSIVSAKPQTTRHLITGILTTPECQYVFVDAPGQQAQAANTLNRRLNRRATEAARDADVALFVVEAMRFGPDDHAVLEKIPPSQRIVAAVNKIDTVKHSAQLIAVPRPPGEDPGIRRHRADQRQDREEHPAAAEGAARGAARGAGRLSAGPAHRPRRALLRRRAAAREAVRADGRRSCRTAATW